MERGLARRRPTARPSARARAPRAARPAAAGRSFVRACDGALLVGVHGSCFSGRRGQSGTPGRTAFSPTGAALQAEAYGVFSFPSPQSATMQRLQRLSERSTPRTTTSWPATAAASSSSRRVQGGAGAMIVCVFFVNLHDSGLSRSRHSSDGPCSSLSSGVGGVCCPSRSTIRLRRRWSPPWMWRKACSRSLTRSTSGRGTDGNANRPFRNDFTSLVYFCIFFVCSMYIFLEVSKIFLFNYEKRNRKTDEDDNVLVY